jgi:glyoxylase-like metal-dependent hydrolase (beta-lactamase superfamily II)
VNTLHPRPRTSIKKWLLAGLLGPPALAAWALDVRFRPLADGFYAHIGDTGARTAGNEGVNANFGLVVTPAGALLIDGGATFQSARKIHEAVRQVTTQPVRWVFNTGGQVHRWLGST